MIDFIGSCARQYLTFDNVANFNAMVYALTSFTLTKRIRGFISCFLLGLNEAVNFKSFVGGFLQDYCIRKVEIFYIKSLIKSLKGQNTLKQL